MTTPEPSARQVAGGTSRERAGRGPATSPRYAEALQWAAELHAGQWRKGGAHPYVAHLIAVSALVWRDGGDEEQAIAALLHDAVEDQDVTIDDVAARFGARVAAIVEACTDADTIPKPPWQQRKEAHLGHLTGVQDEGTLRVLAADKVDNARSVLDDHDRIGARIWDRFTGGRDGTVWYYSQMHALLERQAPQLGLTAELGRLVVELERRAAADSAG